MHMYTPTSLEGSWLVRIVVPCAQSGLPGPRGHIVSQARPSHSTVFSSFRIKMRGEGLAHRLCPFGSMIA